MTISMVMVIRGIWQDVKRQDRLSDARCCLLYREQEFDDACCITRCDVSWLKFDFAITTTAERLTW
jgi:hypothetical protein